MPKQKPVKVHSSKLMKSANNPTPKFIKNAFTTKSNSKGSVNSSSSIGNSSNQNQNNIKKSQNSSRQMSSLSSTSSLSSSTSSNTFEKSLDTLKQRHFQRTDVPSHLQLQTQQSLLTDANINANHTNNGEGKLILKPSILAHSNNVIFRPALLTAQYDNNNNNNNNNASIHNFSSLYEKTATLGAAINSVTTSMAQIDSLLGGDETNVIVSRSINNNKMTSSSSSSSSSSVYMPESVSDPNNNNNNNNIYASLMADDDDDDENENEKAIKKFTSRYTLKPSIITSYGANDYEI